MNTRDDKLYEAGQWWLRLQEDSGATAVGEWLAWAHSDPANLDAFDRVEATAVNFKRLDAAQRDQLAREFSPDPIRSSSSFRPSVRIAIAATLILGVAAVLFYAIPHFSPDAVYSTRRAVHQDVILVDGSHVTVGARSSVAVRMREDERHIQLRDGEAYFKVQQDPLRPFVVDAGKVTVTAVGTAFNVRKTGENIAVSVTEGRVRVTQQGGDTLEAVAGERILYDPRQHRFNLTSIGPARAVAWRERRLEFVNEPLSVVISNVNRYARSPVTIADTQAAQLTFTGTVSPDELSAWLSALPDVLPVQVARDEDEIRIYFQTGHPARLVQ